MNLKIEQSVDSYRKLCEQEATIPLFSQAWWLDAVAPNRWNVVLALCKGVVVGALPYLPKRMGPVKVLSQPPLTQTLGPWVRDTMKSRPRAMAYEKDVLGALAAGLPAYNLYRQNWNCAVTNWLPFFWAGFEQSTRYTYQLDVSQESSILWKALQQNIRGDIRKAETRFAVQIRPAENLDEFLNLNAKTFQRQGLSVPYSRELVQRIEHAAESHSARSIWIAEDSDGALHACAYIVWWGDTAYYLMGGADPELRSSGASSLCLWHAITSLPEGVSIFDFEGSMLEPIERFFRAFGAMQTPYFRVTRVKSRFLRALLAFR